MVDSGTVTVMIMRYQESAIPLSQWVPSRPTAH